MRFYLGTHQVVWLRRLRDVPLFVSHRRLIDYSHPSKLPRATTPWALDSGGFTELSTYGEWRTSRAEYVDAVHEYRERVGMLEWASPQDWMTEDHIVAKTGLSVLAHQERTVQSVLDLRSDAPNFGFIAVLQGQTLDDYLRCVELYDEAGIDLRREPVVGVGSVCRRQSTGEVERIIAELSRAGLRLHGFGVKTTGLKRYGAQLTSADSMAWSFRARQLAHHDGWTTPGCTHRACNNCARFALMWRDQVLSQLDPEAA